MPSSQYEAEQSTKEDSHHSAFREIAESRKLVKNLITRSGMDGVPPNWSVINQNPPEKDDIFGGHQMPHWDESLRGLHSAILEFRNEVRPYRGAASELWNEKFARFNISTGIKMDQIRQRFGPDEKVSKLKYKMVEVSLEDLREFRFREIHLKRQYKPKFQERQTIQRPEKVHICPRVAEL